MSRRISDVQREIEANDPPIKVNQEWAVFSQGEKHNKHRTILRKVRILAKHPDEDYWIVEDLQSRLIPSPLGMTKTPEFNLRYVFELYRDVS